MKKGDTLVVIEDTEYRLRLAQALADLARAEQGSNLAGMAVYFPLLFRMKFRFTNQQLVIGSAIVIAACNLITLHSTYMPLLLTVCFIEGMAKLQGTFEHMSNIQLWITPRRDFGVFFPVLHIVLLTAIEGSGFFAAWFGYHFTWQMMHVFIIGSMYLAGATGFGIYTTWFSHFLNDDISRYGQYLTLTRVNPAQLDLPVFMENYIESMMMIAIKQIYGIVIWISGSVTLVFFLLDIPAVRTNVRKIPLWSVYGIEYLSRLRMS